MSWWSKLFSKKEEEKKDTYSYTQIYTPPISNANSITGINQQASANAQSYHAGQSHNTILTTGGGSVITYPIGNGVINILPNANVPPGQGYILGNQNSISGYGGISGSNAYIDLTSSFYFDYLEPSFSNNSAFFFMDYKSKKLLKFETKEKYDCYISGIHFDDKFESLLTEENEENIN